MSTLTAPHSWPVPTPPSVEAPCAPQAEDAASAAADGATQQAWTSRRNCSLTPVQLFAVYAALCALTLLIGLGFWAIGVPAMLPFAGAEVAVVGVAWLVHARHVGDHETLRLAHGRLTIEHHCAASVAVTTLCAEHSRVDLSAEPGALIAISAQGRCARVGRYLRAEQRRVLARDLRLALHRASAPSNTNLQPPT